MARAGIPVGAFLSPLVLALVALAASGVVLGLAYSPSPEAAHGSVAQFGGVARAASAVHAAAASVALVLLALAAARAYVVAPAPKATVLAGGLLAALLLAAYESGAVLPWDQRAWEAWLHVRDGAAFVGLRSGGTPADAPLGLVFAVHAWLLPLGIAALAGALAWRSRAALASRASMGVAALALGAIGLLALAPPAHGPAPIEGLAVSAPHWPFLWLVPLERAMGSAALMFLPLALVLVTLVGIGARRMSARARLGTTIGVALVFLGLSVAALL